MDIKLIPKEYKKSETPSIDLKIPFTDKQITSKFIIGLSNKANLWLGLTIGLLVFSILSYGGLFIYQDYSSEQLDQLQSQVSDLENKRDKATEAEVKDLGIAIKGLKTLLEKHIYSSRLFVMIEELTLPQVQFSRFKADIEGSRIILAGLAASYKVLAEQLTVLENDQRLISVGSSNIGLSTNGQVQFNLSLDFDPDFLRYQANQ